mgnify:CR=1 FL=1
MNNKEKNVIRHKLSDGLYIDPRLLRRNTSHLSLLKKNVLPALASEDLEKTVA